MITLALTVVFWIVKVSFATQIYSFIWALLKPGHGSPLALVLFAATAPVLVAIPFGYGFGFLPWRRPLVSGLLIAAIAAGLNLAFSVWGSFLAGYAFLDSRSWVDFLAAALLVVLFAGAAALGARATSPWPERQRLVVGSVALASLTALAFGGAYMWYQSILEAARAA